MQQTSSAKFQGNSPLKWIPELDGVRRIAILTVLLYHLFSYSMFRQRWSGAAYVAMKLTKHLSHACTQNAEILPASG